MRVALRAEGHLLPRHRLPESLTEFLEIWCADLLAPLNGQERDSFLRTARGVYAEGPYPSRLDVQRHVEIARGIITGDAAAGALIAETPSGVRSLTAQLADPDRTAYAVRMLSAYPYTDELLPAVDEAFSAGLLTGEQRVEILSAALKAPPLPPPADLPAGLMPVPSGYPRALAHSRERRVARSRTGGT